MATGSAWLFRDGVFKPVFDALAKEKPFRISIQGIPFTVTMHTPANEIELIHGLLFTEGLITEQDVPLSIVPEYDESDGFMEGADVLSDIDLKAQANSAVRNLSSVSSCGLCGKTELPALQAPLEFDEAHLLDPNTVHSLFDQMQAKQIDFAESGGTHAAAAFDPQGNLIVAKEDIGRHNAVDKVIGHCLLNGVLPQVFSLCVSGRISYEIVSKALAAGIPVLASVSAPSELAVQIADANNMTLLAFCRKDKFTVYTHPHRISGNRVLAPTNV
jgi:FdhD protein